MWLWKYFQLVLVFWFLWKRSIWILQFSTLTRWYVPKTVTEPANPMIKPNSQPSHWKGVAWFTYQRELALRSYLVDCIECRDFLFLNINLSLSRDTNILRYGSDYQGVRWLRQCIVNGDANNYPPFVTPNIENDSTTSAVIQIYTEKFSAMNEGFEAKKVGIDISRMELDFWTADRHLLRSGCNYLIHHSFLFLKSISSRVRCRRVLNMFHIQSLGI